MLRSNALLPISINLERLAVTIFIDLPSLLPSSSSLKTEKKNHVIRNCGAATIIAKSNKAVFQTRTLIVAKTSNFWPNPCGQKFIGGGCDNWQIMASDAGAKQIEINNFEPVGNRSAPFQSVWKFARNSSSLLLPSHPKNEQKQSKRRRRGGFHARSTSSN